MVFTLPTPRFSLRLLLVVVTVAAVGLGVSRRLYVERPVTEKETKSVEDGMTYLQVRWRLGAPKYVGDYIDGRYTYGFDYADSEELPLSYFLVVFENGRACAAARQEFVTVQP